MDSQQAKILLEKINALQRSINLNKGPMASIERDLMLSYIRQLYEVYLDADTPEFQAKVKPTVSENDIRVAPKPQEVELPKPTYTPPKETYMPPKVVEPPKPPIIKEEPVVQRQPVTSNYQPTYTPPPPPVTPAPTSTPPPVQPRSGGSDNPKYSVLFSFPKSNELSERLSDRPIPDLTKAFAINDRLLYINELFGRDATAFNDTLQLLNKFDRMDEAKSLLVSVAEQYDWTQEERLEIAQSFVKTVRRKYV